MNQVVKILTVLDEIDALSDTAGAAARRIDAALAALDAGDEPHARELLDTGRYLADVVERSLRRVHRHMESDGGPILSATAAPPDQRSS